MGNSLRKKPSFKYFSIPAILMAALLFHGCLERELDAPTTKTTSTSVSFKGITSATNTDGTRISISWIAAENLELVSNYEIYELSSGTLTRVGSAAKTATSFTVSGLTPCTTHTYVVRALDTSGTADSNTKTASALTYAGITSITLNNGGTTTATFPACTNALNLKIYCSENGAGYSLVKTALNSATSYVFTTLTPGLTATCKVNATGSGGDLDGNTATAEVISGYPGPLHVKVYGDASMAPAGTTSARQVTIAWSAFAGATTSTVYKLVRVNSGDAFDPSTTTACTNVLTTSCQVCTATGLGAKNCTDTAVAASPQVYDYVIISSSSTSLPTTDDSYRIKVQIPPDNMVLVHRDAVNLEICQLMNKSSDPLNHQRCSYTGLGNVPYSNGPGKAPLNLSTSYYDFGYNLFVDRWEAGCNWTAAPACGGGGCIGAAGPGGGVGVDGNVFYDHNNDVCYVKISGTWTSAKSSMTTANRSLLYTNTPRLSATPVPPISSITQEAAALTCQSVSDANYGAKRILRLREFIAAAAFPWLPGEPNALTDPQIETIESGVAHPTNFNCNAASADGVATAGFGSGDEWASSNATYAAFMIGSSYTKNCVSRYGIQDLVGNFAEYVSDNIGGCYAASHTCTGTTSTYDDGNRDLVNYNNDGVIGPGAGGAGLTFWSIAAKSNSANYFSVPLGLPMVGTDSSNALGIGSTFSLSKFHADAFGPYTDLSDTIRAVVAGGGFSDEAAYGAGTIGRFSTMFYQYPTYVATQPYLTFRCAIGID